MFKYAPIGSKGFSCLLVLAFLLFPFGPEGRSEVKLYDTYQRDYNIRLVDPDDDGEETHRRLFTFTEYSVRAEESFLEGRPVYIVTRDEGTAQGDRHVWRIYLDRDTQKLLRTERKIITREGKTLETFERNYSNHFHEYPDMSFPAQMFPYAGLTIDISEGAVTRFAIIFSPEYRPWKIIMTAEGEETVTVPAGTFDCIRIRITFDAGNLPKFFKYLPSFLLDRMMPDTILWVEKESPHSMIKLQGMFEGFASPQKVHELIKVQKD